LEVHLSERLNLGGEIHLNGSGKRRRTEGNHEKPHVDKNLMFTQVPGSTWHVVDPRKCSSEGKCSHSLIKIRQSTLDFFLHARGSHILMS
jgi:GH24 family phage-related lysozyme (muramidase)